MRKIHGRPLLPWWVYAVYFLIGLLVAIFGKPAGGDDMRPAAGSDAKKARHGRYGDTELIHANPFEKAILKALGGAGTINPHTGLREYYEDPLAGTDYTTGGGGFYSVNDTTPAPSFSAGGYTTGTGAAPTGPATPSVNIGDYTGPDYTPDRGSGFTFDGPQSPAPTAPDQSGSLTDRLNPMNIFNNLENKRTAGATLAGILGGTPFAIPAYFAAKLNWDRFGGNARADVNPDVGGRGGMEDAIARTLQTQPVAAPTPAFLRPAEQAAPAPLGLGGGLTDLQKRAQIATGGTQGNTGVYRTPEAMRYYGNLIARALIGENNRLAQQNANLLPIEDAYLKQAFGVTPQNNAAAVLEAIRPYWSA